MILNYDIKEFKGVTNLLSLEELDDWVNVLESNKYHKGVGALLRNEIDYKETFEVTKKCYCCLGVLAKEKGKLIDSSVKGYFNFYNDKPDSADFLNFKISFFSLQNTESQERFYLPEYIQGALASINDKSDTFKPVVAFIIEQVRPLFVKYHSEKESSEKESVK